MIKELTKEWLQEKNAREGLAVWFCEQKETNSIKVIEKLIAKKKLRWANWLITRVMPYTQRGLYAIFAADEVRPIYEKERPDDTRIRDAIDAARKCIDNPTQENKTSAHNAAYIAHSADYATDAAYATYAAAYADYAVSAVHVTYAAAFATYAAAGDTTMRKILMYGLALLKEEKI